MRAAQWGWPSGPHVFRYDVNLSARCALNHLSHYRPFPPATPDPIPQPTRIPRGDINPIDAKKSLETQATGLVIHLWAETVLLLFLLLFSFSSSLSFYFIVWNRVGRYDGILFKATSIFITGIMCQFPRKWNSVLLNKWDGNAALFKIVLCEIPILSIG